jgi:cyclin B
MYEHYRYKEETTTVDRMYMGSTTDKGKTGGGGGGGKKKQPHINETMRCILVDWLVEVHYKFKLFPETLYLTVNLLDRFLSKSKESITKRDLQLVGVTALLISSKYEEMYIPELRDLTYICDGAYTEAKVRTVMKLT